MLIEPSTDTLAIESPLASKFFLFTRQTYIYIYVYICIYRGWGTLILEGHSLAVFSSNPGKKIPNPENLDYLVQVCLIRVELNSAGTPALQDQRSPPLVYILYMFLKWYSFLNVWKYTLNISQSSIIIWHDNQVLIDDRTLVIRIKT